MELIRKMGDVTLDLLFPPTCVICRSPMASGCEVFLCADCIRGIEYIVSPFCLCCGIPFEKKSGGNRLCGDCLLQKRPYLGARSLALYTPPVSSLLHRLKYRSDTSSLKILSELSKRLNLTFFHNCQVIFPVPLHRRRLQARGLNQSLLLARIFFGGTLLDIVPDGLIRTRETLSQTGLSAIERSRNLSSAFMVKDLLLVKDKVICLVDDVLTTGSTAEECSKTLLKAGALGVKVLTLARVEQCLRAEKS